MIISLSLISFTFFGCKNSEREFPETKEDKSSQTTELQKVEETSKSSQDKDDGKKLLARVNGTPIYEEDLRGRSLEYVIQNEILYDEALRRGFDKRYDNIINDYIQITLTTALKNELYNTMSKNVAEHEINDYYNANLDKYTNTYVYEVSTKDEELANDLHKRLIEGDDPNNIVAEFSGNGKEEQVILKEFYLRIQNNDYFEKLEPGELSNVIKGRNYYLIYKIIHTKVKPLQQVSSPIKYKVNTERKAKLIEEFAEKIKGEQGIEVEILDKNQ